VGPASRLAARTVRELRRGGAGALGGALLGALAALLVGGTVQGLRVLERQVLAWRADLRIVATLREPPAAPEAPDGIVARLRALPGVTSARYVAPDAALAELARLLGPGADGLSRLPRNPVPARVELAAAPALEADALDGLVAAAGELGEVEEVQAAVAWVRPLERLARLGRAAGLGLGALVAVTALLAIAGATRVARLAGAPEARVLRLAGVGEALITGPLLLQALLLGVLGAGVGWGVLAALSAGGIPAAGGWLAAALGGTGLPPPPALLGPALAGGGLLVGLLGGLLGVAR
jgi:cell division protein FtsX